MLEATNGYVPVFIDTLNDVPTTKRFGESYGSYPVLRVHDHDGRDIAGRLDGNPVAGEIPTDQVLALLERGRKAFDASSKPRSKSKR